MVRLNSKREIKNKIKIKNNKSDNNNDLIKNLPTCIYLYIYSYIIF